MDIGLQPTLQQAVEKGIEAYITSRRARIPVFIDRHFSFRGALALHRKTFGRDFYKHPVNLLWGLPVALGKGVAALLDKAGAKRSATWLNRLPRGIPTVLQQELQWLIYTDLLELPYAQEGRESSRDALMAHILAEPWISALCEEYLTQLHSVAARPEFRGALERHLEEYGKTRGAVSELAGSLITLAAGYAALSQATPGAIAAVGVVTALAWIVLDPLLATTGIHRRRLDRFVTALGEELRGGRRGDYRVRDHYIARVFDVLDLLRAATKALR